MNFLAHLYLSGDDEELILGNFIADSVKGKQFLNYPPGVQKGILLHRKIDAFTDTHPIVDLSKERLRGRYRKYASVIVDVYYDHFLAANWKDYSNEELNTYAQNVYHLVQRNHFMLPERSAQFSMYMIRYNILEAYSRLEGIERVLQGMSKRARFESGMEHALEELSEHYIEFEKEFRAYFEELKKYVETVKQ